MHKPNESMDSYSMTIPRIKLSAQRHLTHSEKCSLGILYNTSWYKRLKRTQELRHSRKSTLVRKRQLISCKSNSSIWNVDKCVPSFPLTTWRMSHHIYHAVLCSQNSTIATVEVDWVTRAPCHLHLLLNNWLRIQGRINLIHEDPSRQPCGPKILTALLQNGPMRAAAGGPLVNLYRCVDCPHKPVARIETESARQHKE